MQILFIAGGIFYIHPDCQVLLKVFCFEKEKREVISLFSATFNVCFARTRIP
jgi:hypothetical protein